MNNNIFEILKHCAVFFQQNFTLIVSTIGLLGIGIDITPWIKINPVKAIVNLAAKKYGAYILGVFKESAKDLSEKIDEQSKQFDLFNIKINQLNDEIEQIKSDNIDREIYDMRWEILDFSNAMKTRDYSEEMYNHIMDVHDRYERKIKENNLSNGRVDLAYANILDSYKLKFT